MNQSSLLNEHPELEKEKKRVEKIVKQLGTPEISPNKSFSKKLRKQLQVKINEKKAENPRYLAFYLHNFRFYFSGFSVALGIFCILFVLGFFSFNKNPELLKNPKTLNRINDLAFGEVKFKKADSEFAFATVRYASDGEERPANEPSQNIITQARNKYHIGENQLPKLEKNYPIFKKLSGKAPEMALIAKGLRFPDFKLGALKTAPIQNLEFKASNGDENFFLDVNKILLGMNKFPKIAENEVSNTAQLSDASIKKIIKHQLNQRGISLENYGKPKINTLPSSNDIELFYPRIIDNKEVWKADQKAQEGLELVFNTHTKSIESFYNLNLGSYQQSNYPLEKTANDILKSLEKHGNIDVSKKGGEYSIPMQKGKIILLDEGELLTPALLFKSKPETSEKTIILPLF